MTNTIPKSSPLIESKRIWLEELSVAKHLRDYHEIWSNPKALIWSTQEPKKSLAESENWIESATKSPTRPWVANYAIILRPMSVTQGKAKMIGTVGVHGLHEVAEAEGHRCSIGYMINHDYWGHGYATEALEAFLGYWFKDKEDTKEDLIAEVDTENWASMQILQKMAKQGYGIREGELNKGTFKIPGKGLRDMRIWYISKGSC